MKFTSFCVNILITVLFRVLKMKINLVKLTFGQQFPLIKLWERVSQKCGLWKIHHVEYGPFLATDWLETKGSGRVMG